MRWFIKFRMFSVFFLISASSAECSCFDGLARILFKGRKAVDQRQKPTSPTHLSVRVESALTKAPDDSIETFNTFLLALEGLRPKMTGSTVGQNGELLTPIDVPSISAADLPPEDFQQLKGRLADSDIPKGTIELGRILVELRRSANRLGVLWCAQGEHLPIVLPDAETALGRLAVSLQATHPNFILTTHSTGPAEFPRYAVAYRGPGDYNGESGVSSYLTIPHEDVVSGLIDDDAIAHELEHVGNTAELEGGVGRVDYGFILFDHLSVVAKILLDQGRLEPPIDATTKTISLDEVGVTFRILQRIARRVLHIVDDPARYGRSLSDDDHLMALAGLEGAELAGDHVSNLIQYLSATIDALKGLEPRSEIQFKNGFWFVRINSRPDLHVAARRGILAHRKIIVPVSDKIQIEGDNRDRFVRSNLAVLLQRMETLQVAVKRDTDDFSTAWKQGKDRRGALKTFFQKILSWPGVENSRLGEH